MRQRVQVVAMHTGYDPLLHSPCRQAQPLLYRNSLNDKFPYVNPRLPQSRSSPHTSSTHGSWKNSLLLNSSCRTVIPSDGPLPNILSKSRDCDSNHVWINLAGSSANDCKNVRFKCELCNDCASRAICSFKKSSGDTAVEREREQSIISQGGMTC